MSVLKGMIKAEIYNVDEPYELTKDDAKKVKNWITELKLANNISKKEIATVKEALSVYENLIKERESIIDALKDSDLKTAQDIAEDLVDNDGWYPPYNKPEKALAELRNTSNHNLESFKREIDSMVVHN